jgi:hypothetical protein
MKTKLALIIPASAALLALLLPAQEQPRPDIVPGVRILPAPAPDIDEPEPPPFEGGDEAWAEPGFHPGMIMDGIPHRYQIMTVQMQKDGKPSPVVLKLDTMTGQTWQLTYAEAKFFRNGKVQTRQQLNFVPIAGGISAPQPMPHGFPGVDPNQPDGIENGAGAEDGVEALPAVPLRPAVPRPRPLPPAEGATTESSPVRPALPGLAPRPRPTEPGRIVRPVIPPNR